MVDAVSNVHGAMKMACIGTFYCYTHESSVLDAWNGSAILDTKWCLASAAEQEENGYGILGIADATGYIHLLYLKGSNSSLHFSPCKQWRMNEEAALCLSLDWSDRMRASSNDARLIVSQSNGTVCTVPNLGASGTVPHGLETWRAHDFEAWIAAWDCWTDGVVAWSGTRMLKFSLILIRRR